METKYLILGLYILLAAACNNSDTSNAINYSIEPVKEAVPFAKGVISSENNSEFSLMFTPDGRKVYFSRRAPEQKQKIYEATFENGKWTKPVQSAFSTDRDEAPSITPNGELFFFGSERPLPNKPNKGNFDMNIWMMKKSNSGWSKPEPLPFPINDVQIEGEEWPSSNNNFLFTIDNETFYFTTMVRGTKAIKLYQTKYVNEHFSTPIPIKGIFDDEKFWIYSAVVSPDGNYLVFNSYGAPGGAGGEDIFVSKRNGTEWSKAKPIGPKINSNDEESGPRFSRDGKYFFFTRAKNLGNYEYGEWDIFYIETEYLQLEKLFE
ncbi:MAG: hypothetical protein WBM77_02750 [Maribacter sp.]